MVCRVAGLDANEVIEGIAAKFLLLRKVKNSK